MPHKYCRQTSSSRKMDSNDGVKDAAVGVEEE